MIYLAANHASVWRRRAAGLPMGWIMSPAGWRSPVRPGLEMPYAIDNGMYYPFGSCPRDMSVLSAFYATLGRASAFHAPLFVVVPDAPYDADGTRAMFTKHQRHVRDAMPGVTVALAVQDGMGEEDLDAIEPPGAVFRRGVYWMEMEDGPQLVGRGKGSGLVVSRCPREHVAKGPAMHRHRRGLGGRNRNLSRRPETTRRGARGFERAAIVGVMRAMEARRDVQGKPNLNDFISSQERADAEKHTP